MRKPRYYVDTWDVEKQAWTPQQGVRRGPYTLFGLRKAIRKLRDLGYPCDYSGQAGDGDPFVSITREYTRAEQRALQKQIDAAIANG